MPGSRSLPSRTSTRTRSALRSTESEHGVRAWVAGEVRADDSPAGELAGRVEMVGRHPGW